MNAWNNQKSASGAGQPHADDKIGDSIFAALLESGLPPQDVSLMRLKDEAISVVGGGLETTTRALTVASYHILANPPIYGKLKEELTQAIPDPQNPPSLNVLLKLPYLTVCIEEGKSVTRSPLVVLDQQITLLAKQLTPYVSPLAALRLSYGVSQRSIRTCPEPMTYGSHVLPSRVLLSMDTYSVLHDEHIFPESHSFKPERWLHNPKAPDGRPLAAYMVAFGRGSRSCLGRELAYAEMYIALANAFRRFDWELYETGVESVAMDHEVFVPRPKVGTKGVRAICK